MTPFDPETTVAKAIRLLQSGHFTPEQIIRTAVYETFDAMGLHVLHLKNQVDALERTLLTAQKD